ncbi:ATP-binding cassette domain-containing protein [archaeon]|nr:MAG: ATP-binding cassette domain-containing protein [archaeon]
MCMLRSTGAVAQESINAVRTVSAFNLQPVFVAKYRVFILEAMRVGIDKGMHVGLGNGAVFGAAFLTYALGFWYGGKLVADDVARGCTENCLTGGTILAVFFSTIMGSMALGQMAPPLTSFATAQASIAIIFDLLGRKPLIDGLSDEGLNLSTMRPNDKIRGEIEVRQVCFAYPSRPSINICKDFDLLIRPGETVALVGASGCGKSTIINLLLRFYDPQSGNILVDGYDIKSLNIKYLRSLIGYVGQEPILFAGTIGDNIAYGLDPQERERLLSIVHSTRSDEGSQAVTTSKKQDLMERIMTAAKAANAHDFIMEFPDGYDTDVGTNGSAMSGGQKQRIAIARALIKKPAILLLDEATSALDVHSEKVVQASIDKLAQSKTQTTIIIAHRLSTIVNADRICVLQDGKVVEQGPHLELIKKTDGVYSELVKMQMMSGEEEVHGKDEQGNADIGRRRTVSKAEEGKDSGRVSRRLSGDQGVPGEVQAEDGAGKKDKEPPVSKDEKKALMSRVFKMIKQYPGLVTTGLGGALFFGALFPCWGLLLAKTQASFFLSDPQEIRERAQLYAFLYIMLAGVAFFGSLAMFYGVVAVGEHVAAEIRSSLYESYFHHPITFFDDVKNSVGNLTTQLAEDTRYVSKALGESFAKQLQAMATLLVAIIIGFKASWIIALIVIGAFPLNIVASAIQMQAISGMQYDHEDDEKKQQQDQQQALANKKNKDTGKGKDEGNAKGAKSNNATSSTMAGSHSTVLSTAFTNMRTVSAFSMQHKVSHHYAIMTQEIASKRTERSIMAGWGFGGSNTVLFLTYSLLFWVGAKLIKDGSVTFEELMTAILSLMLGALGIGQALGDLGDQVQGLQMAKKIFEAMDTANNSPMDGLAYKKGLVPTRSNCHFIQAVSSGKEDGAGDLIEEDINAVNRDELFELTGKIELRNVNFSYPTRPDVPVCTNYNLTINSGEVIAFVGPSGSGKSTIINLLLRFYDPDSGSILVDDMDIRKLNLRYLRSQIG